MSGQPHARAGAGRQSCPDGATRGLNAHVTGGGIPDNLGRILPPGVRAEIDARAWERPPIFDLIAAEGPVEQGEMFRTFNMGIGMIAVLAPGHAARALALLESAGHRAWEVGRIEAAEAPGPAVSIR